MTYRENYEARMKAYGETSLESMKINSRHNLRISMFNSPSYQQVLLSKLSTPVEEALKIDALINDNGDIKDEKKISTFFENDISSGCLIDFQDKKWLMLHYDNMNDIYKRGIIRRCYTTLRWQDNNLDIREAWFARKTDVSPNFGIEEGKIMTLPDERRQIILQSNEHTQKFKKTQRFILDNRAWEIITLDDIADGIINVVLKESQLNPSTDSLELRIANYQEVIYKVIITNGESTSVSIDQSLQLNVEAFKNTTPIPINELTFTSLDESIATVNSNGLIIPVSTGTVYIQANYKNASAQIKLTVRDLQYNNYTVDIEGSEFIYLGAKQTYKALFKNNGAEISEKAVFSLFDEDGKSVTKKAIVSGIQGNSITLLGDTKLMGYIVLSVTSENGLIKGSRKLRVKGYL
ncbi:Ig-like domain-containing protein [Paenibacillus sp. FSL P4-0502]|uniref:Ig-like domain-containing protein n=1 Tax=Paenibacillus sp. FSL P4-0502 TaxID=2975319 RepID=UPI0030F94193